MILHELVKTTSTISKEHILRTKADTFDKQMFQYAYDPELTYGVKFGYINWNNVKPMDQVMHSLLDKLAKRQITGNAAREAVEHHAQHYGDLIKLICNKDLDCGVTATTLNKVFGKGFIPSFNLQRAVKVEVKDIKLPCIGQLKYNGARCVITISKDGVKLQSRGGHYFEFPELQKKLDLAFQYSTKPYVIEGELTFGDSQNSNHTTISGLINSAIKGTPITAKGIVFTAFDFMMLSEFRANDCNISYSKRWEDLTNCIEYIWNYLECNDEQIQVAMTWQFNTHEEIQIKFDELISKGYEGMILKHWDHLYTFKKNKNWIKLKAEDTADLHCIDIIDGKDKFEGGIGSLVCVGTVNGKSVKVNVSSGLTEAERFSSRNNYLDRIIEVGYNDVIQDKNTGEYSLFIPKFKMVRGDKGNEQ